MTLHRNPVNHQYQGQIVEQGWNHRPQRHGPVGHADILRQDKGRRPHDWRRKQASGGGDRLNGSGLLRIISDFFHQWDGKGPGSSHIGCGRAGDHSQKRAGGNRRLGRAAPVSSCQSICHIHKPRSGSQHLHKRPEGHKQNDVGSRCPGGGSKDALRGNIQKFDHVLPALSPMGHKGWKITSEHRIPNQKQAKNHHKASDTPSGHNQQKCYKDCLHNNVCHGNRAGH